MRRGALVITRNFLMEIRRAQCPGNADNLFEHLTKVLPADPATDIILKNSPYSATPQDTQMWLRMIHMAGVFGG